MDQSITERPAEQREPTEAEKLLAFHPSTKHLTIPMTETPFSTQVAAHGYNLDTKTLCVRFAWGNSEYHYHRVPPEVAAEFAAAKSKGGFLKDKIKGVYHFECTKPREDKRA